MRRLWESSYIDKQVEAKAAVPELKSRKAAKFNRTGMRSENQLCIRIPRSK